MLSRWSMLFGLFGITLLVTFVTPVSVSAATTSATTPFCFDTFGVIGSGIGTEDNCTTKKATLDNCFEAAVACSLALRQDGYNRNYKTLSCSNSKLNLVTVTCRGCK
ncbi:MAG: hypothetical protein AAGF95_15000 [Chloroflexota bacterium]